MRSIYAVSVLMLAACGDDGGSTTPKVDAPPMQQDAPQTQMDAPPSGSNALGRACTLSMDPNMTGCPAGNQCVTIFMGATMGWCSPPCTETNGACAMGYGGPAGGMPTCALETMEMPGVAALCAVICTDNNQCQTGTTCKVAQGMTKICAP